MNKQDWLDYFEAINGRSATEEEISQAIATGELLEEVQVSAESISMIQEESVISDATEKTVGVQTSPEVQAQQVTFVQPESQVQQQVFVQSEGQAQQQSFVQQGPQVQGQAFQGQSMQGQGFYIQTPSQAQVKSSFKVFWEWLVASWKSPSAEGELNKTNGYLAFGFLSLFYTITIFMSMYHLTGGVTRIINSFNSYNSQNVQNPLGISAFFMILISSALYVFSIIFSGFVVKRLVYQDSTFTFTKAFDWYGRLFSINILLTGISALFALIGLVQPALFIFWISLLITSVGVVYALIVSKGESKMDPFYKYLIAILLNGFIMFIFFMMELSIISNYIGSIFGNIISNIPRF
ncbi:DUF6574 domain-containing protein [Streptococcus himalayensis]|uniref:Response regulator (Homolog to RR11 Spn) n=1 Tax=Streptococcus himalayensis TaxID=1888195 RepID=A0A917EFA5_9STRE|nr:DUF6574 domain-containing protein [Streptococcus himalayensis]GGE32548.1 hypothetical protein GCM10011510_12330 [Streptococcus himalayensis]